MIMQHFRNYNLDKNGNIDGLEILKAAHKMNGNIVLGHYLTLQRYKIKPECLLSF